MGDMFRPLNSKVKSSPKREAVISKYSELQQIPSDINRTLTSPSAPFYLALLGEPRMDKRYSNFPNVVTNPALLEMIKTDTVGPFNATGLKPAVDSLKQVMQEVTKTYPDLVARLNNNGMLAVRYINGTKTLSNHSWGGAIDLGVDRIEDKKQDDKILHGLAIIIPIFNKHGWYSGAGYKPKKDKSTGKLKSNEDSMHFEVSKEKILGWATLGLLGLDAQKVATKNETNKRLAGQTKKSASKNPEPRSLPANTTLKRSLPKRIDAPCTGWFGRRAACITKATTGWTKSWFR